MSHHHSNSMSSLSLNDGPSPSSVASLISTILSAIDEARKMASSVPVDTSSFLAMSFYLRELKQVLQSMTIGKGLTVTQDAWSGVLQLRKSMDSLRNFTRVNAQRCRMYHLWEASKIVSDLQSLVQEVGHDLNRVHVMSLMATCLPKDAAQKVGDLRGRMRSASFECESEVSDLSNELEEMLLASGGAAFGHVSKARASKLAQRILKYLGLSPSEAQVLKAELEEDLERAHSEKRDDDVDKLMELKAFLSATLFLSTNEAPPPLKFPASKLSSQVTEDHSLAVPDVLKCGLSGEIMLDPVVLKETGEKYDRRHIEQWFAKGNRTCFRTSKSVRNKELVVDEPLRSQVSAYIDETNRLTVEAAVRFLRDVVVRKEEEKAREDERVQREKEAREREKEIIRAEGGEAAAALEIEEEEERKEQERLAMEENRRKAKGIVLEEMIEFPEPALRIAEEETVERVREALAALVEVTEPEGCGRGLSARQLFEGGGEGVGVLVRLLRMVEEKGGRTKTLIVLKYLAGTGDEMQERMIEWGVVQPLVCILKIKLMPSVFHAVALLQELSRAPFFRSAFIDGLGVIELIKLLKQHTPEEKSGEGGGEKARESGETGGKEGGAGREDGGQRAELAGMLSHTLELYWRDDPYVAIQMASVGMFKPLVELLGPESDMETRLMMADGVMTWGVNKENRVVIVQAGAIPHLIDLLTHGPNEGKVAAARAIEHLSHTEVNRIALAKAGIIPALIKAQARGSTEVKHAATATLENLAMDDQDVDSLDEDGTAVRLITMLQSGPRASREYAIRTLECTARDSKSIRAALVEDEGAIPAVFDLLLEGGAVSFASGSLRSSCLLLLGHMSGEAQAEGHADLFDTKPEVVKLLSTLLSRPIPLAERESIVLILTAMADNKRMRSLLQEEESLFPLVFRFISDGSPKMKESALTFFGRLAEPNSLDTQIAVSKLGILPTAAEYLTVGPDVLRVPSAQLLTNLSLSTPRILEQNQQQQHANSSSSGEKKKGFSLKSYLTRNASVKGDRLRHCKVHQGKCSFEATFCLIEGDLLFVLLELVRKGDDAVAEVSLSAVASLLADDEDLERAADYLVKMDVIEAAASMVGRNTNATKWGVYVLERIFSFKKYQQAKFTRPAVAALGRFMTTATGQARKTAAETLMRLNIMPKNSSTFDL